MASPVAPRKNASKPQRKRAAGAAKQRAAPRCPRCDSPKIAPIVYGYPSDMDAYLKASKEGLIVGGGCVVTDDDPVWSCRACTHQWGRRDW